MPFVQKLFFNNQWFNRLMTFSGVLCQSVKYPPNSWWPTTSSSPPSTNNVSRPSPSLEFLPTAPCSRRSSSGSAIVSTWTSSRRQSFVHHDPRKPAHLTTELPIIEKIRYGFEISRVKFTRDVIYTQRNNIDRAVYRCYY